LFLSCATSSPSQEGKHFKALKGLENVSLISCGLRAAPYRHCHSDAAALVTLPDGFHAAPHFTLHAQDPFIGGLVNTTILTKKASAQAPLWAWGSASGYPCACPAGKGGLAPGGSAQEVTLASRRKREIVLCLARATPWNQTGFWDLQSLYFLQCFNPFGVFVIAGIGGLGLVWLSGQA